MTIILKTKRVTLVKHTVANLENIHAWRTDPQISEMSSDRPINSTLQESREKLEGWIKGADTQSRHLAIQRTFDGKLIGFSQIAMIDQYASTCRIGIVIGEKSLWGQGYGTETIARLVDFCVKDLGVNRVMCEAYQTNLRSLRMLVSAGFQQEGILRENVRKDDRFIDEHVFGLIRSDYLRDQANT